MATVLKAFLCASFALVSTLAVAEAPTRVALEIDRGEVYAAQILQSGHLYVGVSRRTDTEPHRVDIYAPQTSTLLGSVALTHSVESMASYSNGRVVVIGKHYGPQGWVRSYSVISQQGGRFVATTKAFRDSLMPEFAVAQGDDLLVNDAGSQAVLRVGSRGTRAYSPLIHGPGQVELAGNYLYAIVRNGLTDNYDDNLVRIDLADESASRTFPELRAKIANIHWHQPFGLLAVSETLADQVHLVDPRSNTVRHSLPVASPWGLASLHSCLVVSSRDQAIVTIFRLSEAGPQTIASWNVGSASPNLTNTRYVLADEAGDRLYARSVDVCPSCSQTRNLVVEIDASSVAEACR